MNEKSFLEVFDTLELDEKIRGLLEQVVVTKVSTNRKQDVFRIYITSKKLIAKNQLFQLAKQIQRQIFGYRKVQVYILETFRLSDQYTPAKLWDIYEESVLTELERYSPYKRSLMKQAQMTFPDEHTITVEVSDKIYDKEAVDDLLRILDRVFNERCGFRVKVDVKYLDLGSKGNMEKSEAKMRQKISFLTESLKKEQALKQNISSEEKEKKKKENPSEKKETYSKNKNISVRRSDNPEVLYGRDFDDEPITLDQVVEEMGEVTFRGKILSREEREIRGERTIITLTITDFTDSIHVKMFTKNEMLEGLKGCLNAGDFVKVKGLTALDRFDHELTVSSVVGIKRTADFTTSRMDYAYKKRVELHCHTKMSDMDGVTDASALLKRARAWGMPALAITDHGCVQAFTEASHTVSKDEDFKVIYGVEGYLVDDLKEVVENSKGQSLDDAYVVFDLETTGLSAVHNQIIEIGAVKVEQGKIRERFSTFVNPKVPIPFEIEQLTGISDEMVLKAPVIEDILPDFLKFCEGCVLIAHNASFDAGFIEENCKRQGIVTDFTVGDTVSMARILLPTLSKFKLDHVAKALQIPLENHHRAVDDAACTAEIFLKFIEMLKARDITDLDALNQMGMANVAAIKKMWPRNSWS